MNDIKKQNLDNDCQMVVFSDNAYNAIISETYQWDPKETGGILMGHILNNGCWIVMEVIQPGYGEAQEGNKVFHQTGYFEYNQRFVNYMAKSVANKYKQPLQCLGLWHRHPGSMDFFSGTDDGTNLKFAAQNPAGALSALINIDPKLRMTMYHVPHWANRENIRNAYRKVQVEVGSDLIPESFFQLRYVNPITIADSTASQTAFPEPQTASHTASPETAVAETSANMNPETVVAETSAKMNPETVVADTQQAEPIAPAEQPTSETVIESDGKCLSKMNDALIRMNAIQKLMTLRIRTIQIYLIVIVALFVITIFINTYLWFSTQDYVAPVVTNLIEPINDTIVEILKDTL